MTSTSGGKCKSLEVAHKLNELWRRDLKLHEQQLKVAEKQLAENGHLVEAVWALTSTLNQTSLGESQCMGQVGADLLGRGRRGQTWRVVWRMVQGRVKGMARMMRRVREMVIDCTYEMKEGKEIEKRH